MDEDKAFNSIEEEGQVFQVLVGTIDECVTIEASGAYTSAVIITPQTAREIAAYLINLADEIESKNASR